ncbi:MAG: TetR/AcrR family transcriptional regulator [Dysgonamonadaceae bacterium]|jgi:AcrR family transcriptional regulator|nr:TetR/AcrR family transcriptional regulator [Dysgonamonadaceae bacterium]MDD3355789.1 TetR/AcrR family transcriptional regulator [Dysgonamonadaceae bacterium]MDD3727108.1 TetR/AcrR family transcriptional regulator [Dysgonamonadaceae bacterium]MDD4246084.1 TetR/AcrR family transcriptional regulator [Dysgonamonadaceae bacterium]MDD4605313.1 TetR/AcrR family transcriptional regulator [Dysgonamonadaceae bacterium]
MSSVKTKDMLIEKARQLFARSGFENTTMNDIAEASQRGRRTLYTYFSNKKEIYNAVIESELENLYVQLQKTVEKEHTASDKLMLFFVSRLEIIKEVVTRNGTLKGDFFRDIFRVENVRKTFDRKEISFLKMILDEGVESNEFEVLDTMKTARILHFALKGLEVPYIRGVMTQNPKDSIDRDTVANLIFTGIIKK